MSTEEQHPETARQALRDAASALGFELALELEEIGSGARSDRPGLQRVMNAAEAGEVDVVLVWSLDRFGRSTLDLLANVERLGACGVRFICTAQGIDVRPGGDPMSALLLTMLAGVAEFERAQIRERTKQGLRRARSQGKRLGRPMKRGNTKPDPEKVRTLRAEGASWAQIARLLFCSPSSARRAVG